MRFISESIGAEVSYDDATRQITVSNGENTIEFTVGNTIYTVNGEEKILDAAPEISEGRTLIPLRALVEALGKEVFWDDRGLIVISDESDFLNSEEDKEIIDKLVEYVIRY